MRTVRMIVYVAICLGVAAGSVSLTLGVLN